MVHRFFDWELISTQEIAAAFDYPFEEILADDGIPYAPVVVNTSVDRYPCIGDTITVETVPRSVGESSVELVYEMYNGDGDRLARARIIHVTISPDGTALSLPDQVRSGFVDACVNRNPSIGSTAKASKESSIAFSSEFKISSPYIEGAELAYFEEYPRFADIALEKHLENCGTSLNQLQGKKQPYRIRTVPTKQRDVENQLCLVDYCSL